MSTSAITPYLSSADKEKKSETGVIQKNLGGGRYLVKTQSGIRTVESTATIRSGEVVAYSDMAGTSAITACRGLKGMSASEFLRKGRFGQIDTKAQNPNSPEIPAPAWKYLDGKLKRVVLIDG